MYPSSQDTEKLTPVSAPLPQGKRLTNLATTRNTLNPDDVRDLGAVLRARLFHSPCQSGDSAEDSEDSRPNSHRRCTLHTSPSSTGCRRTTHSNPPPPIIRGHAWWSNLSHRAWRCGRQFRNVNSRRPAGTATPTVAKMRAKVARKSMVEGG